MTYENLLYSIPLIFFGFQLFLSIIIKKSEALKDLTLGLVVIPFATAFYFLNISLNLFILFIILSFICSIIVLVSFATDTKRGERIGVIFLIVNVIVIVFEYLLLYRVLSL